MATPTNPRFIQAQSFQIQASGASAGDTTLVVQSFKYPDGTTNIVTADLGDWCYGTLEPNNGSQEEAIQFTGVTQNANGTATLTGISSVGFKYPYTLTTGLAKSHAGGVTFIISNDAGMYGNLISYFGSTLASGIAPNASLIAQGSVQLPTQVQVDTKTATGSTAAALSVTPDTLRSTKLNDYVVDTGSANAYAIAPTPVITSYATGQTFTFKALTTSASGTTLAVNGLTAVPIKKNVNVTLSSGDILPGQIVQVEHDGSAFQIMSPLATNVTTPTGTIYDYQPFTVSGTWTKPAGLSGTEMVIVHLWGGGGGGGAGTGGGAGGGGGGAFVEVKYLASTLASSIVVTVATGAAHDVAGNNSTFGSLITAYGGGKGGNDTGGTGSGGGGGGVFSVGSNGSGGNPATGATGGTPLGGAANTSSTFGGGGGATSNQTNVGASVYGGGGGGAGAQNGNGGNSLYGGGGGGGGTGTGGTSVYGGAGGNGVASGTAAAGTAPAGGGGAPGTGGAGTGGAGARGECRVWTIY